MDLPLVSSETILGKTVRLPLRLLPRSLAVPIMTGRLRGKRWIVGSAIHRCWFGIYERAKQEAIADEIRPESVFYDIGANVGFYSLLASSLVGRGKIFAFEPVPRNIEYLKKHLALNRITNVEVLPLAVSDTVGTASFEVERSGFMGHLAHLPHIRQIACQGATTVSTTTLDCLLAQGRILPPDCIKMDIEGAELAALRGARECILRHRPVIFLATHGRDIHRQCCELLESWGYDHECLPEGRVGELDEVVARFRS